MAGKKLQGQVALITGASRGIGAAAAERLAAGGAAVVLTARDEETLAATVQRVQAAGGRALGVAADVADPEQIEQLIERMLDELKRVDILVNNAGVIWPLEEVADADLDEWAYAVHVNLVGPFFMARNVLPLMLAQNYGRIINISSGAARRPIAGASAYCASKAGLDMFTQTLALELAKTRVTANCLHPGMVDTDMQADIRSVDTGDTSLDFSRWHDAHSEGRLLSPAAVAEMIYWLAGPWAHSYNGQLFEANDADWRSQVRHDVGR